MNLVDTHDCRRTRFGTFISFTLPVGFCNKIVVDLVLRSCLFFQLGAWRIGFENS